MNAVSSAEPAAPAAAPVEVRGEAAASLAAQRHDTPVRVSERTSETEEVVANPDGTFTFSQSLYPVRVRQGDEWRPVDLTLARREDGSVGPVAATVDLRLSGGGEGPLVVLGKGEHEIGLGWSGSLPKPHLDGPTATYPEVFPGVDILVTAEIEGFSQVLVVKDAKAADNPVLRTISYLSHTRNTVVEGGQDGLTVRDSDGKVVFTGDASRMWDSAGPGAAARRSTSPEQGARRATMGVEVTGTAVAITPDQAFLDDPDTVYPVYLDPEYSWPHGRKNHHVVVQSAWPDAQNYDKTTGDFGDLKAGYACDGPCFVSRSYVEMNTAGLVGKFIHRATLGTTVVHSNSCAGAGPTGLWLAGAISHATTWRHQPGWLYKLSSTTVTNNATYCPNPHGGGAEFDVSRAVTQAADPNYAWPGVILMLATEPMDEGKASHWRRFALNPHMQVVYNSYPNAPDTLSMRSGTKAIPCVTGANRPFIADTRPWLRARFTDPEPGVLNTRFYWGPLGQAVSGSAPTYNVPPGSIDEVQVPVGAFANGKTYSWRTHASDSQLVGPYSPYCEVTIDTTPPGLPTVSSTDYPENSTTGYAGDPGAFTLSANGTTDVVRYVYTTDGNVPTAIGSPSVNAASLGGNATITLTAGEALNRVKVRSVDRANNEGPVRTYEFTANAQRPAVANWPFDRQLGNLTYGGTDSPTWIRGYTGDAIRTNPATLGHLTTAGPVVDTRKNFSVSAWVRPDSSVGYQTVASQDGNTSSSFFLQYHDRLDRWAFRAADGDSSNPVVATAASRQPPAWHQWTHLLGTYDAHAKKLRLYVNGVLEGETQFATSWTGAGPFVVGAAKTGGQRTNYFTGGIDAVRVWDRVVGPMEAAALNNAAVPRAHYKLDEGTGTTTVDETTGQQATFHGDATWVSDQHVSARISGNPGSQLTGPRPTVRTGQSFTVSAWVRVDAADGVTRSAVAFADPAYSPFLIGYNSGHGKWGFSLVSADHTTSWALISTNLIEANRWVHLTGVYDSVKKEIRVYVNGELEDSHGGVTGWGGSGGLQIGGGTWDGVPLATWKGNVDDIRMFSGVRDDAGVRDDMLARSQGSGF